MTPGTRMVSFFTLNVSHSLQLVVNVMYQASMEGNASLTADAAVK